MRRLLLACALLLLLAIPASHAARAAGGMAQVAVVNAGTPLAGQQVVVMASEGKYQGTTDSSGRFSVVISGKTFRLKVNNRAVPGVFQVTQGVVQVDLSTL